MITVLGIDPGSIALGWALLGSVSGTIECYSSGAFFPRLSQPRICSTCQGTIARVLCRGCGARYAPRGKTRVTRSEAVTRVGAFVAELVAANKPNAIFLESAHVGQHANAVLGISEVRGAVMGLCGGTIPILSVEPTVHKKVTAGSGNANKLDVAAAVRTLFPGRTFTKLDETDAVSIAYYGIKTLGEAGREERT